MLQAACALSVSVGSYSDPPDIQGLAHFVEHMVFMGSEKYPKENDFDSYIKVNILHNIGAYRTEEKFPSSGNNSNDL